LLLNKPQSAAVCAIIRKVREVGICAFYFLSGFSDNNISTDRLRKPLMKKNSASLWTVFKGPFLRGRRECDSYAPGDSRGNSNSVTCRNLANLPSACSSSTDYAEETQTHIDYQENHFHRISVASISRVLYLAILFLRRMYTPAYNNRGLLR